eukprot:2852931-Alexandrium_andersonii.AAC.1
MEGGSSGPRVRSRGKGRGPSGRLWCPDQGHPGGGPGSGEPARSSVRYGVRMPYQELFPCRLIARLLQKCTGTRDRLFHHPWGCRNDEII